MVDTRTVYVDDSGTDGKSRIAAAAFCVSAVDKWVAFQRRWKNIATNAGFEHFHMTEFAACREVKPCNQCQRGDRNTLQEHTWRRWPEKKRRNVLRKLAETVVEFVEYGVGIAHTKEDYDKHVKNSPARALATEPVGDEYFTFAVQECGGSLAKWRAREQDTSSLKFVFDLCTNKQRDEIAKVFFGKLSGQPRYLNGVEQWLIPESVSYESRRNVVQLLSADMLAWAVATLRARQLFMAGEYKELMQIAEIFVDSDHIKIGHTHNEALKGWEDAVLNGIGSKISEVRRDVKSADDRTSGRDQGQAGCREGGKEKTPI